MTCKSKAMGPFDSHAKVLLCHLLNHVQTYHDLPITFHLEPSEGALCHHLGLLHPEQCGFNICSGRSRASRTENITVVQAE